MKVTVIQKLCQGHGLCHRTAPEIFALRDFDGHAEVATPQPPEALRAKAEAAQSTCPEYAIRLGE